MELTQPIRTPRLHLRTLTVLDATPRYLSWTQDVEVMRYIEARLGDHSLESLRAFVKASNEARADLLLGICLRDGRHIGNIKLGPINEYHHHAAVGILIGKRDAWGRGFASEAIIGLTRYAFTILGLEKLYAGCYASNHGSRKAFANAGYVEEGRQKSLWRSSDIREDNIQMGLTRLEWKSGQ